MNSVPSTAQHSTAQHSTAQHSTAQPYLASDSFYHFCYCEQSKTAWQSRFFRDKRLENRDKGIVLAGESYPFYKVSKLAKDCALTNYHISF